MERRFDAGDVCMIKTKTILELSPYLARQFFLKNESYVNFNLPPYFDFEPLLNKLIKELKDNEYQYINKNEDIKRYYELYVNKDNGLDWRSFKLINPIDYVNLVLEITKKDNWETIKKYFKENKSTNIKCTSIPKFPNYHTSQKATTILDWLQNTEEQSIKASMEYTYLATIDISNCYDSLYTHLIPRTLAGDITKECLKNKALKKSKLPLSQKNKIKLGNYIDTTLQKINNNRTIGLPQGNVLSDFLAEIVLKGFDKKLENILGPENIKYKIIRYRDDYRIFCNNKETLDKICKELATLLSKFGLRLNKGKTNIYTDIISNSIKSDKWNRITQNFSTGNLKNEFLYTYKFSKEFPNSGSLITILGV
ncbi:MAG: RNA-directed DNA polymerase [Parcubacteria group bacterium]|nr:RNA-directed DNA polymerase [Parcubacteria group bacterium]